MSLFRLYTLVTLLIPTLIAAPGNSGITRLLPPISGHNREHLPRLVIYAQTHHDPNNGGRSVSLRPLVRSGSVTHVIIAAFHVNGPGNITLNDHSFDDKIYDELWSDKAYIQGIGIKTMAMLGGASVGTYEKFGNVTAREFENNYLPLKNMLKSYNFDGIDLDVEEVMELGHIRRLIGRLKQDFGSRFLVTLAPVYSAMGPDTNLDDESYQRYQLTFASEETPRDFDPFAVPCDKRKMKKPYGEGPLRVLVRNLSGFSYKKLQDTPEGELVDWYNVQCYCGWGLVLRVRLVEDLIEHGWQPEKIVLGSLTSNRHCKGFVDPLRFSMALSKILANWHHIGGVFGWELYNHDKNHYAWPDTMACVMQGIRTELCFQVWKGVSEIRDVMSQHLYETQHTITEIEDMYKEKMLPRPMKRDYTGGKPPGGGAPLGAHKYQKLNLTDAKLTADDDARSLYYKFKKSSTEYQNWSQARLDSPAPSAQPHTKLQKRQGSYKPPTNSTAKQFSQPVPMNEPCEPYWHILLSDGTANNNNRSSSQGDQPALVAPDKPYTSNTISPPPGCRPHWMGKPSNSTGGGPKPPNQHRPVNSGWSNIPSRPKSPAQPNDVHKSSKAWMRSPNLPTKRDSDIVYEWYVPDDYLPVSGLPAVPPIPEPFPRRARSIDVWSNTEDHPNAKGGAGYGRPVKPPPKHLPLPKYAETKLHASHPGCRPHWQGQEEKTRQSGANTLKVTKPPRKELMTEEDKRRYKEQNWKVASNSE